MGKSSAFEIMIPLISIVIPTYNRANTVVNAIESVLHQHGDCEIIVVDDGSEDNTEEVLRQKFDSQIIYIYQENCGVSAARNKGVSMATGDFLIFLDSDDTLYEGTVAAFSACIDDQIDLISGKMYICDESGKIISKKTASDFGHPLAGSFALRKTVYLDVGGYDEKLTYSENTDLFLRLRNYGIDKGREVFVEGEGGSCIITGSREGRLNTGKTLASRIYFLSKHECYFKLYPYQSVIFNKIIIRNAIFVKNRDEALRHSKNLIQLKPFNIRFYALYLILLVAFKQFVWFYTRRKSQRIR